jgi:hypothetical protein
MQAVKGSPPSVPSAPILLAAVGCGEGGVSCATSRISDRALAPRAINDARNGHSTNGHRSAFPRSVSSAGEGEPRMRPAPVARAGPAADGAALNSATEGGVAEPSSPARAAGAAYSKSLAGPNR